MIVLFVFAFFYFGLPLLCIFGIVASIIYYLINKLPKRYALMLVQVFLIGAIVFSFLSQYHTSIMEMFMSGIFGAMYIWYGIMILAKPNNSERKIIHESKIEKEENNF